MRYCSKTKLATQVLFCAGMLHAQTPAFAAEAPPAPASAGPKEASAAPKTTKPPPAKPVFHAGPKTASEAAALDQSLVLLVFMGNSEESQKLRETTLHSLEFKEQGGALQIAEISAETDTTLARAFAVRKLPALVLVTPEDKIVARRDGFLHPAELMLWLREARDRVKAGEWEGTGAGSNLGEFAARAAAGRLGPEDMNKLIFLLGEPDPADRDAAGQLLASLHERAMPPLIQAVTNSYLGVRIATAELLRDLAPDCPPIDPWQSPAELAHSEAAVQKWWSATKRLSPSSQPKADPAVAGSIDSAIATLRGTQPVARTEAMADLSRHGKVALPAIRAAIKACEKASDHRTLTLLEDVRWAILVPDALEKQADGVRLPLARGKSQERQAATLRLGRCGQAAITPLAELASDPDPLVIESAVRALSTIGGKSAIPAMAALLKASDSNLRMTAAQALGKTKNSQAIAYLLPAFEDLNEVVACVALAAVEEIHANRSGSSPERKLSPDLAAALKKAFADPRWRVRATAVEVAGKVSARELGADLQPMLKDPDGFVVKSALEALQKLGAAPEPKQLLEIARHHAGLKDVALQQLAGKGSSDAVEAITELYQSGSVDTRLSILRSLGHAAASPEGDDNAASAWDKLIARASAESDPKLRRAAAGVLASQPPGSVVALVSPLLNDEDPETRSEAAGALLALLANERRKTVSSQPDFVPDFDLPGMRPTTNAKTNPPPYSAADKTRWNTLLREKAGAKPDIFVATALFATGTNASTELPLLVNTLRSLEATNATRLAQSGALGALLPALTWPAGKPVADRLCASPSLFLGSLQYINKCGKDLRAYLLDPARFLKAVDTPATEASSSVISRLLSPARGGTWTLMAGTAETEGIVRSLALATNPIWRAVSIYVLGQAGGSASEDILRRGSQDTNAWVRLAAINALGRHTSDRAALEKEIAPFLADKDPKVVQAAATWLLEPETRSNAGFGYPVNYFRYESIMAGSYDSMDESEQRPLAPMDSKPAFLETIRERLKDAPVEDLAAYSLLLAQYGDNAGLDLLLEKHSGQGGEAELETSVLAAIALARDPKYIPYVRKMLAAAQQEWDYRRILQALKGVNGAEARALRLEVNRRLRSGASEMDF